VFRVSEETAEYVKVNALRPGSRGINTVVKVVDMGTPRTVSSRRDQTEHRVSEALVGDETGSLLLTLWDDQIDQFSVGNVFEIKNGFTSIFRGSLRLNLGRYGTAEKVEMEIAEVNTENNLSERRYEERPGYGPPRRPFQRRRWEERRGERQRY